MRKILFPAVFIALFSTARVFAMDLGLVSVNDTISLPLVCLDTLGRSARPDSVHVLTWYHGQGGNAYTYGARSVPPASASYIDTVSFAGITYFYFIDLVGDIDSNASDGPYSGEVVLWYQSQPTVNPFSFVKVGDEARDIFARIDASISSRSDFNEQNDKVVLADSIRSTIDSILASLGYDSLSVQAKLGAFGASQSSSTTLTLQQWLKNSVGIDGINTLHSKVDGLSLSGGGTEPETLIVMSAADSTLIQGARTTIRTLDQSTVKVDGFTTDVNGKLIVDLDPASFFVAVTANNYSLLLDTLPVAPGGGTDTLWLTEFNPGSPSTPDLCRVYGWVYDLSGLPLSEVTVAAEIPAEYHPVKYSGAIITPFKKMTTTDANGYWQIDLFPNSLLSDQNSRYSFRIEYPSGVVYRTKIEVPDFSSWQLP